MSVSERISPNQVTESVNRGPLVGLSVAKEEATTTDDSGSRAPSPDPSCSICLDNVMDAAFTDRCCHRFCFNCLLSWSRVKPECPLCKVQFSFIIHNVRSLGDYDKMPVTWAEPPPPTVDANFLISVAFDRPRFRYRTTGGGPWDFNFHNVLGVTSTPLSSSSLLAGSSMVPNPMATSVANSVFVPHSTSSMGGPVYPHLIPTPPPGNNMALEWRRRRQISTSEFRRNIYTQNQWVLPPESRPGVPYRIRESSPSFYRNNPAQVNRLIPWLHRELLVLLDVTNDYQDVCQWVMQAITIFPIRSSRFLAFVRTFLHERAAHFCHEFYHFATSPYDSLAAYDMRAEYRSQSLDYADPELSDHHSSGSDVEIIETPFDTIEISDNEDDGVIRVEDADSDASVQIISSLPALADRTPEIIDLIDDSDSDVCAVNSSRQNSTVSCSKPGRSSSPEEMDREWAVAKRLRTRHQPYYKDDSFSSDEDVPKGKKRKIADPPKKRWRKVMSLSSDGNSAADIPQRSKPSSRKKKSSLRKSKRILSKLICDLSSSASEDKYKSSEDKYKSSTSKSSSSKRSSSDERKKEYFREEEERKQLKSEEGLDVLFSLNLFPPVEKQEPEDTAKCKYSSPGSFLSSVSDEDALENCPSSPPSSPSPKPRLKSVVKKMDSNLEAGCSSWSSSHNLRQRKATHYNYISYSSTSDSDS